VRAREKPAVWEERVEAHRRSGMTIKAYAAKIGVNPNTLSGWRWKLRRRAEREQPAADAPVDEGEHSFTDMTSQLAAALGDDTGVIEVELGHALVRVRGHVEREALAGVLEALGGRAD